MDFDKLIMPIIASNILNSFSHHTVPKGSSTYRLKALTFDLSIVNYLSSDC